MCINQKSFPKFHHDFILEMLITTENKIIYMCYQHPSQISIPMIRQEKRIIIIICIDNAPSSFSVFLTSLYQDLGASLKQYFAK